MQPKCLNQPLDPHLILDAFPERKLVHYKRNEVVYRESDPADAVYYLECGSIKIARVSPTGREAVVALVSEGDFVGENGLIGVPLRQGTAVCMADSKLWRIPNEAVLARLRGDKGFAELFMAYLLERNCRYQDDLADQLFNSTEKRLARALLLLAHLGHAGQEAKVLPAVSHETLAGIVGTTRARVSEFMSSFKKAGFIEYDRRKLVVRSSLFDVVMREPRKP
jgi:CRP/FNR family transcriptional regulator, cyclic AMP receptor protein